MRTLIRIAGSVALLSWLAVRTDWSKLAAAFAELHWPLWIAGVGLYLLASAVSSVRWQLLARPLGFDQPARDYIHSTYVGLFFSLFLPSVGSDVVRAWYLDAGSGRKRLALLSVLIDRALGLAVLLAMVLVAFLLYPGELPGWVAATVWIFTGGALLVGLPALVALAFPRRSERLLRWRERALLYAGHPRVLGGAVVLSVLNVTLHVLVVWTIGLALRAPVPGSYYWLIVPIVSLATLAPISINGIGVREATTVAMLAPLGVGEETALTLVFLWFMAFTAGGACGLGFYLLGHRRPDPALLRQAAGDDPVPEPVPVANRSTCGAWPMPNAPQGKHRFSLSMLGWALNEEQNIAAYIDRAGQYLSSLTDDFELVLIDDGSTDRTFEIARAYQQTRPWLRIFANDRNRGSGYNAKRAISLATKDYLFWQTTDWAYEITRLGENLGYLADHEVLQGVRLDTVSLRGLLHRSDNWLKAVISITNYLLVRLLFRLPLHDYQNVTIYPRRLIQSVRLESESAFTNPECLLKVWWKGARFKEVPVAFLKRQHGQAKGTRLKVILASIGDIVSWWWRWIVCGRRADRGRGVVHYWSEADDLGRRATPPDVERPTESRAA